MELTVIQVSNGKIQTIQFVSTTTVKQMKVMKVICSLKNILIQELQRDMESRLIEGSTMKMHRTQFVSMRTVIQMKLMKVTYKTKNMMIREFQ
jgi:hypothetical protein